MNTPLIPIHKSEIEVTNLSVGPSLVSFDQKRTALKMKSHLINFLRANQAKGRFARPLVEEASVAKMILKHARRKVAKSQPQSVSFQSAVYSSAKETAEFYASKKERPAVLASLDRGFGDLFPGFLKEPASQVHQRRAA